MSKKHTKKRLKNRKNKNKMGKQKEKLLPSLSKRDASSNWFNFVKSNGLTDKLSYKLSREEEKSANSTPKTKPPAITKVVALDCEMVADLSDQNMLARVSIVNFKLECIYDKYVKPTAKVGDYRTRFSGIREEDLKNGAEFETVQEEMRTLLRNKILVGHSLFNDFRVLKFGHHKQLIRDTSNYPPFKEVCATKSPSLKKLAKVFLNENIQEGEHNSIEDARTAMKLYKKFKVEWEKSLIKAKPTQETENHSDGLSISV